MKVLLCYKSDPAGARDPFTSLLPIGTAALHAFLSREGIGSALANLSSLSWRRVEALLRDLQPDVVAISQFTHNRHEAIRLAELTRKLLPAALVVLGGAHASHRWKEQLSLYPAVDVVVVGEGEETLLELVRNAASRGDGIAGTAVRKNGIPHLNRPRPLIPDLDRLPFPAEYLSGAVGVDLRAQAEFVTTSRGCFCSCRFCSSPDFWQGKVRFRSPRSMVDEIRTIRDRNGLIYFSFRDDTFTVNRKRVLEFCRLLVEEKVRILWSCQSRVNAVDREMLLWMRRAGCESIQFGIESGSLRMLEALGKGIEPQQMVEAVSAARRVGMRVSIYLISGVPGEAEGDLAATLTLLDRLSPHDGQVSPLAYFPGTMLFRDAVARGAVPADIFETSREPGIYARSDPFSAKATASLLARLEAVGVRAEYSLKDIAAQETVTGFCHAGRIALGERLEAEGNDSRAEAVWTELTIREPENPWGWLALGELHMSTGRYVEALNAFRNLLAVVPAHLPGYEMAALAAEAAGNRKDAESFVRRKRELDGEGTKKGGA